MAERRLSHLRSRLSKDLQRLRQYSRIIADHESKGYISRVTEVEGVRRFVPHHPVFNLRKSDKVRIVFDYAAIYKGFCLNDFLYSGPDLVNALTGVLSRFRLGEIAIAADIEEMFLQVRIPARDRPALNSLWFTDGNLNNKPDVYEMKANPFGARS